MSTRLGLKAILTSLMVMGIVGALIGNGLIAYFNDTETDSNNTFTAGTIDIAVNGQNPWNESYHTLLENPSIQQCAGYRDERENEEGRARTQPSECVKRETHCFCTT